MACFGRMDADLAAKPNENLSVWLERFESVATPGPNSVPWHAYQPGLGVRKQHLLLGFITHGNELGTIPAAVKLAEALSSGILVTDGPVSILLGNVPAAQANVRFREEDLNRVCTFDRAPSSWERRRAEELRPLLDSVDFFLDFHQTQTPTTSAFWTFPWEMDLGLWARVIGAAPLGLTRKPGGAFSKGTCCLDEYVRGRGRPALTAELGTKGWDENQAKNAYQSSVRLIRAYDQICSGEHQLETLAARQPEISWFETRDIVPAQGPRDALRPGLCNWMEVQKGELLSAESSPEIRANHDGMLLFPKYTKPGDPPAPELFRLGVAVQDPSSLA
jgi:succinylglutamate desuccinylase